VKKTAKFSRSLLEISCHLPGHGAVSRTDLTLRERLGTFPFNMENKDLN
jgi:hypothetical protein